MMQYLLIFPLAFLACLLYAIIFCIFFIWFISIDDAKIMADRYWYLVDLLADTFFPDAKNIFS